jgi:hypothetical protein
VVVLENRLVYSRTMPAHLECTNMYAGQWFM